MAGSGEAKAQAKPTPGAREPPPPGTPRSSPCPLTALRLAQGDVVWHDGQQCTVQYVNSKGLLDLRNTGGAVFYGVAAAGTTSSRRAMPPPGTE